MRARGWVLTAGSGSPADPPDYRFIPIDPRISKHRCQMNWLPNSMAADRVTRALSVLPVRLAALGEGARAFDVVLAGEVLPLRRVGRAHRRLQGRRVEAAVDHLLRGADRHRRAFEDLRCPAPGR